MGAALFGRRSFIFLFHYVCFEYHLIGKNITMVEQAITTVQPGRQHDEVYISIVIPAYNEEKRIGCTLEQVHAYFTFCGDAFEIIVVDDGSNDGTEFLARRLARELGNIYLVSYAPNHGKGYAVKQGVLASHGRFVLITDADLSTPIDESEKLLTVCRGSADVAFGSRALPGSKIEVNQSMARRIMGRVFNLMVRVLAVPDVKDTQCGFKCLKGDIARELFAEQVTERFAFDVELLARAKKTGRDIAEVPIRWLNMGSSTVRPLTDAYDMFRNLIKIRRLLK